MAQDAFDFSDVFNDIENKINDFMSAGETKELLQRYVMRKANENVYGAYTPTQYERRYSLLDTDTYEVTTGRLSMSITSWARGEGLAGIGLTDVIESGVGYEWTHSQIYQWQPFPRPFMAQGVNDFVDDYLMPAIHNTFFND